MTQLPIHRDGTPCAGANRCAWQSMGRNHQIWADVNERLPEVGQRICLVAMPDDPDPIPVGSTGIITGIHLSGPLSQVLVDWDVAVLAGETRSRSLILTTADEWVVVL